MTEPDNIDSPTLRHLAALGATIHEKDNGRWQVTLSRGEHHASKVLTASWLLHADASDPQAVAETQWRDMVAYLDAATQEGGPP